MAKPTLKARALEVARERGIARARDFAAAGVPRVYLQRLRDQGLLARVGRGLYQLADAEPSAAHSLAEAARAVPRGTVGLLSALQYHGLTTQTPHEVWMLLPAKAWAPTSPPVAIRVVRASGAALTAGVERHAVDGVPVPVTVPAKTVADCFKHRSKVGLDVALEALKDCLRARRASVDELWRYAAVCRVRNVMRPYLEALL
jgi:predicted transcriptional regulator of viral defense system